MLGVCLGSGLPPEDMLESKSHAAGVSYFSEWPALLNGARITLGPRLLQNSVFEIMVLSQLESMLLCMANVATKCHMEARVWDKTYDLVGVQCYPDATGLSCHPGSWCCSDLSCCQTKLCGRPLEDMLESRNHAATWALLI